MPSIQYVQQKISELQEQSETLSQKIKRLRKNWAIETDPATKYKLETQIAEAEAERDAAVQELEALTNKLAATQADTGFTREEIILEELLIPGKRYAFLVGPQYFQEQQGLAPLTTSGNDVDTFRRLLKEKNIGGFHETIALKGKVSGYQIAKEMQKLFAQTDQGDLILLYFSGHVGINAEGGWYFLDSETSVEMFGMSPISLENIKKQFILRSKADSIVLILDCLYCSESATPCSEAMVAQAFEVFADVSENKQIVILSSLAQTVAEKEGDTYSLLTQYLIEGIESGRADFNQSGRTTLHELYRYVCAALHLKESQTRRIEPLKWELHAKGDIVLASTTDKPLAKGKYKHIADLLKKGEVIPFLGIDAVLPSLKNALAEKMAGLTGLDPKAAALTILSQYYETKTSRYDLYCRVKEIVEELAIQPTATHYLLAAIEKPMMILTTVCAPMIERLFQERDKKYVLLTHLTNPENEGDRGKVVLKYFHGKEAGETEGEILPPERLIIKDLDAYSVIYKIQGGIELRAQAMSPEEVDSLIISERDYLSFLEWFALPEPLNFPLKTRMLLFLGCSLLDWSDRVLIHALLRDRSRLRRQPYAVRKVVDPFEETYWKSKGVELIEEELEDFINEVAEDLEITLDSSVGGCPGSF